MSNNEQKPTDASATRQKTNRLLGLSSYAAGTILLGIIGFGIYDDPASMRRDTQALILMVLGALVCFGIGFTTGRKK